METILGGVVARVIASMNRWTSVLVLYIYIYMVEVIFVGFFLLLFFDFLVFEEYRGGFDSNYEAGMRKDEELGD